MNCLALLLSIINVLYPKLEQLNPFNRKVMELSVYINILDTALFSGNTETVATAMLACRTKLHNQTLKLLMKKLMKNRQHAEYLALM